MGIGSSSGAFYASEFHRSVGQDNNVVDPDTTPDIGTQDQNEYNTRDFQRNLESEPDANNQLPVKDAMPFPDNRNPDMDFVNRFPKDMKSGILNDLKKPTGETVPLVRKINMSMGDRYGNKTNVQELPYEETVNSAALQYKGKVYEGLNHGHALGDILDKHGNVDMKDIKDGFTTSHGRFVSREEAFDIARDKGQIDPHVLPALTADSKMLLSEDLIP